MRISRAVAAAFAVCVMTAVPAAAQTAPAAPATTSGAVIGVYVGAGAVQNVGAIAGGSIGFKVSDNLILEAEGGWSQDAITRAKIDAIGGLATYLTSSTGKAATATLKAPASYGLAGIRYLFKSGGVSPYIALNGGVARLALTPAITIGGSDVTTSLSTYGVTLGSDFTGDVTKAAFGGGFGVLINRDKIAIDLGARVTSIQTEGQATTLTSARIGLLYRF